MKSIGQPQDIDSQASLLVMTVCSADTTQFLEENTTSSTASETAGLNSAETLKAETVTPPVSGPYLEQSTEDDIWTWCVVAP